MKILVITSKFDPHVEMVMKHLPESTCVVYDPMKLVSGTEISYTWNGSRFEITYDNVRLDDVDVVWFRKPIILDPDQLPVDAKYQKYVHGAYKRTANAIYALLRDKYWVSDPWAIIRANNKLLQQEVAFEKGLLIPDTIVTNSPKDAQTFLEKHKTVIMKPLGAETVNDDGVEKTFYATKISLEDKVDFSGLGLAPTIFQQSLVGMLDLRVTVVGNKIYTCEIHKKGALASGSDWRSGVLTPELEFIEHKNLPEDLGLKCIEVVKALGLKYGAFDFMLDNNGQYWFLEVNPNGQWGFVELEAGIPVSEGFAELFTNKDF